MFAVLTAADLDPIEMPEPPTDGDPVSVEVPREAVRAPRAWLALDKDGLRLEWDEAA